MTCPKLLCALFIVLAYPTAVFAQGCEEPVIVHKPILPGRTVYYAFDTSDGAWDSEEQAGVKEALDKWTSANTTSGLDISFVEDEDQATLRIFFTCPDCGPNEVGEAKYDFDPLGFVIPRELRVKKTTNEVSGRTDFLKLGLHEGGHFHGLANTGGTDGGSVMNPFNIPHDQGGYMPTDIPTCDRIQAEAARNYGEEEEEEETCRPGACEDTPLVLDIDGDRRIPTTNVNSSPAIYFDLDGDGKLERVGWLAYPFGDAFLWIDLNGNSSVDDGRELFGSATELPDGSRAENGFEALAVYDEPGFGGNGDGMISPSDHVWSSLRLWFDTNYNGTSETGEIASLDQYDIVAISLRYARNVQVDDQGNIHTRRGRYWQRSEGGWGVRPGLIEDIVFLVREE